MVEMRTVEQIESEIEKLVKRYSSLQKQYHGDTQASKDIEGKIDALEIELKKLKGVDKL